MPRLCTVSDVKKFVKIASGFSQHDDRIKAMIDHASIAVEQYLRRRLSQQTFTEWLDVPKKYHGFRYYYFLEGINITSGSFAAHWHYDLVTPLVAGTDYEIDLVKGKFTLIAGFDQKLPNGLRVVYQAGYPSTDGQFSGVASEIVMATAIQSAFMFERIMEAEIGQKNENTQPGVVSSLDDGAVNSIVPEARNLLRNHVRLFNPRLL